jgi:flagellar basal-body rod protein FlgB
MHWHQERQRVLAENVVNADTPNFRPHDLVPPKFDDTGPASTGPVTLVRTNPAHITGVNGGTQFSQERSGGYEVRPAGNAVSLDDEMIKVAANQMDYQAVTSLYSRSLGLFKTALGRR